MSCVDVLSDDEDEMLCPAAEESAAADGQPCEPAEAEEEAAPPLRSVVVGSVDLASDSEDEALCPKAPTLPVAEPAEPPGEPTGKVASAEEDDDEDNLAMLAPPQEKPKPAKAALPKPPAKKAKAEAKATPKAEAKATPKSVAKAASKADAKAAPKAPADATAAPKAPADAKAAPKATAVPKATADKKLSKEEMEAKVLEYMRQQNRPYNTQNVFDNLHGQVPKAAVQTLMDTLAANGKLLLKEYGKVKVYLVTQEAPQGGDAELLQKEVDEASKKRTEVKSTVEDSRKRLAQVEGKHAAAKEDTSSPSSKSMQMDYVCSVMPITKHPPHPSASERLVDQIAKARKTTAELRDLEQRAEELRGKGDQRVDEREVLAVEGNFQTVHRAWKKRKRLCMEALHTLGEGMCIRTELGQLEESAPSAAEVLSEALARTDLDAGIRWGAAESIAHLGQAAGNKAAFALAKALLQRKPGQVASDTFVRGPWL
ncbi:unnamed protein product [Effrenium voratum]|nr:unnamed protein product [Effrenium voratum]